MDDEIVVYRDLSDHAVDVSHIEDYKYRIAATADVMLRDIRAIERGKYKDIALSSLEGVADHTYSKAFKYAMERAGIRAGYCIDNEYFLLKHARPVDIDAAIESMCDASKMLGTMRERMEDSGVHPGGKAYQNILQAKYYVDVWRKQLCVLRSLGDENKD